MNNTPTKYLAVELERVEKRRKFIKSILGIGITGFLVSVFYPVIMYLKPPRQREIDVSSISAGRVKDFGNESFKIIHFGNLPVIVIRIQTGEFKAFSATCTHLDCTVQYRKDLGVIWCACHNGKYDLTGRNISGPPPRPLDNFTVTIKTEEIFISKKI